MESQNLYRVKEEDLDKLIRILTVCFSEDPLYHALIPDKDTRERLMPELFTCDLTEFFETCEIYADSSELNSILVVSDGTGVVAANVEHRADVVFVKQGKQFDERGGIRLRVR